MRQPLKVFYYPRTVPEHVTLTKSILLFDELHFQDAPSHTFAREGENFGTIGRQSELRQYEQSFRDNGVPLYVHVPSSGPVPRDIRSAVLADINDPAFLLAFRDGLKSSPAFARQQIQNGNYGDGKTADDLRARLSTLDFEPVLATRESAYAILTDQTIRPFDISTEMAATKTLIFDATMASTVEQIALGRIAAEGFIPLADATPYGDMLRARYRRAMASATEIDLPIVDLSFAVFDELIPPERIEKLGIKDAVDYRKRAEGARREFLDHMSALQAKQGRLASDADYSAAVEKIIATEIRPAANAYRNKLATIDETMFGTLGAGAVAAAASNMNVFSGMSWESIITMAATSGGATAAAYVGAAVAAAGIAGAVARRAADRECAISYILTVPGT